MRRSANLLPPEVRKQNELYQFSSGLLLFGGWVAMLLAALVLVLVMARIFFARQLSSVTAQVASKTKVLETLRAGELTSEVESVNLNLANFKILQSQHRVFAEALLELARVLPADVTVDAVAVTRGGGKIEIRGRAGSRDSVLTLRQNILQSALFKGVNFPLQNLERPRDVSWKYRFYLSSENENIPGE